MKYKYRIKIVEYPDGTEYYPQRKWKWFPLFWSSWKQVYQGGGTREMSYSKREHAERAIETHKNAGKKPLVSYEEIL